jgi:hypothetical protein
VQSDGGIVSYRKRPRDVGEIDELLATISNEHATLLE